MSLVEGEEVIWEGRPSWRSMMSFYLKWGILALIPVVVGALITAFTSADDAAWVGGVVTVVALIVVVVAGWLFRIVTYYRITTRQISIRKGLLSRNEQTARVERIQNVATSQTFFDRIFNVGTVAYDTAGTEGGSFDFIGVTDPISLRERSLKLIGTGESSGAL